MVLVYYIPTLGDYYSWHAVGAVNVTRLYARLRMESGSRVFLWLLAYPRLKLDGCRSVMWCSTGLGLCLWLTQHTLCAPLCLLACRRRRGRRRRMRRALLDRPRTRHFPEPPGHVLGRRHAQEAFAAHGFQRLGSPAHIAAQIAAPDEAAAHDASEHAKRTRIAVRNPRLWIAVPGNGIGNGA